jgi:nucleotide-binding universal stress UspA family protein
VSFVQAAAPLSRKRPLFETSADLRQGLHVRKIGCQLIHLNAATARPWLYEHKLRIQEGTMYKNILIPTDGSELSDKAIRHGIALAKALGAKITAMTVTQPFHWFSIDHKMVTDMPVEYEKHARQRAEKILDAISKAACAANVECNAVHIEQEHPHDAIIKTAGSQGCDLIVMASHGRGGVSALVLGSETVKVLTHSKIPVLVYR